MDKPKVNPDLIPDEKKNEACRILDAAIRRLLRDEQAKRDLERWKQSRRKVEEQ